MNKFCNEIEIIDSFIKVRDESLINKITTFKDILTSFDPILFEEKTAIKNNSIYFNIFDFFTINEPIHSRLIASLLDPNGKHGQKDLFLIEFLNIIEIEYNSNDIWQVTAEVGKIDILLKCLNRKSVVIIENKSNGAIDQLNQLYRYWYQEMYQSYDLETLNNNLNFKIVYLTPNRSKYFEQQSIQRPIEYEMTLPEKLENVEVWTFEDLILLWLTNCLENEKLPKENIRIREYIKQYVELWKKKF